MDISPLDVINIGMLTRRVLSLLDYRRALHDYLLSKMEQVAPNLAALVGELVGARLISHAGSLTSLAKYPASTVQILGFDSLLLCCRDAHLQLLLIFLLFQLCRIGRCLFFKTNIDVFIM